MGLSAKLPGEASGPGMTGAISAFGAEAAGAAALTPGAGGGEFAQAATSAAIDAQVKRSLVMAIRSLSATRRHPGESRDPWWRHAACRWTPAFAGVTAPCAITCKDSPP